MRALDIAAATAHERGVDHGTRAREAIHAFLGDRLAQIDSLRARPVPHDRLLLLADRYLAAIRRDLPDVAAEIDGLAEGAGIGTDRATLLQIRRELTAVGEDCTLLAFRDPVHGPVLAQTIDLPGDLSAHVQVTRYRRATRDGGDIAMWSYTGLLGYMGMNTHGLAVGINMVLGGDWGVGCPPYLLVRHLLTFPSANQALAAMESVRVASSRSLTLVDRDSLVCVEFTPNVRRRIVDAPIVHTNHFLHPDLTSLDRIDPGRSSTYRRMALLREDLGNDSRLTVDRARRLLADHRNAPQSICCHNTGFAQGKTVSAAIALPRAASLEICPGLPCETPWNTVDLEGP